MTKPAKASTPPIRLLKSWIWTWAPVGDTIGGPPPPRICLPIEKLQYLEEGVWKDVPVEEEPVPADPEGSSALVTVSAAGQQLIDTLSQQAVTLKSSLRTRK